MYSIVIRWNFAHTCKYIYFERYNVVLAHTNSHTHTTRTCTNISLVYYSQNNVMKFFILYILCRKTHQFPWPSNSNIAWLHYFPLPPIFSLLSYFFLFFTFQPSLLLPCFLLPPLKYPFHSLPKTPLSLYEYAL